MTIHIANAERLAMEAMARAWKPPPPVDYLQWAIDNVVFTERESQFVGPFNRDRFPHLDAILGALSPDDPCRIVTVMGSAQIGKTVIANVFVAGSLVMDPCDILYIHPNEENARRWSKLKFAPLLREIPSLGEAMTQKPRDGGDNIFYKERADGLGSLLISGANSPASLSQVSMRRQVHDDLAKWEMNNAGDPEQQADNRSRGYEFAKILKISTPLVMPGCRITRNFEAGSQEYPYLPCPHCGEMQVLEGENLIANVDPERPELAHFTCVACGVEIHERDRAGMMARLEWRAHNPSALRYHRSFWIWSAYAPLQSFERIAREWLKAKGDTAAEQTFTNDTLGRPWRSEGAAPPWEKLRDRAAVSDYPRGTIPRGALVVTLGIDCQQDRVEWQAVGWGRNFRRYVIDYGVIPGHVAEPTCRERLDGLLAQAWRNASGQFVGIDMAAIDGNAWTEDVFDWVRRHPQSRLIMVRGRHEETAPRIARIKRERNEKTGKLIKWASRFYNFAASLLKMSLYRDLAKDTTERAGEDLPHGYVSFPAGLEDDYFRGLTAERRVPKKKHGFVYYIWEKDPNQANEPLDTMLQAETAATKWGVRGLPDAIWARLEAERESPPENAQGDLEDLMGAPAAPLVRQPSYGRRGRRVLSEGV